MALEWVPEHFSLLLKPSIYLLIESLSLSHSVFFFFSCYLPLAINTVYWYCPNCHHWWFSGFTSKAPFLASVLFSIFLKRSSYRTGIEFFISCRNFYLTCTSCPHTWFSGFTHSSASIAFVHMCIMILPYFFQFIDCSFWLTWKLWVYVMIRVRPAGWLDQQLVSQVPICGKSLNVSNFFRHYK